MIVKCPTCGKPTEFSASNHFRPFCGERCQLLDLGAWADEQFKVPVTDQEMATVNENSEEQNASPQLFPPKHHLN